VKPLSRRFLLRFAPQCACQATLVAVFLLSASCPAQPARETQFSQAAQAVLDRSFASPDISYLLLDHSGSVLAERWPSQSPVSPGSLVKPFLAIAYAEQHGGHFPRVLCRGTRTRCWLPVGHGSLSLEEAIAQSCNTYFRELAIATDRQRAAQTFVHYGLNGPDALARSDSLIGLGTEWKESPHAIAKAYLAIERERNSSLQAAILKGMLGSAEHGTAHSIDTALGKNAALAKTGTAVCSHTPHAAADGFTLVLYPAAEPRLLLLVRVHGVTGSTSARTAASMLRSLGAGQ
jgi:hypothetical protein